MRSIPSPRPVRIGRYRYSKLRWRVLVHAFDFLGRLVMAIVRRFGRSASDRAAASGSFWCSSITWATPCSARP